MDALSNTERYVPSAQLHPKQISRIVRHARRLVDNIVELSPTARLMAGVVIGDFTDVITDNPKMHFKEGIIAAKLVSATSLDTVATRELTYGADIGAAALELAAKIEMKTLSFGKALMQLRRAVAQHKVTSSVGSVSGRKPLKSTRKQPFPHRRNANDGKRRKAA